MVCMITMMGNMDLESFSVIGPRVFNNILNMLLRKYVISVNVASFKSKLKTHLFTLNNFELEKLYKIIIKCGNN